MASPDHAATRGLALLPYRLVPLIRPQHQGRQGGKVPLSWDTARTPCKRLLNGPHYPRAHTKPWSTPDFHTAPTDGDSQLPHQCESDACRSAKLIDRLLASGPLPLDRHWSLPQTVPCPPGSLRLLYRFPSSSFPTLVAALGFSSTPFTFTFTGQTVRFLVLFDFDPATFPYNFYLPTLSLTSSSILASREPLRNCSCHHLSRYSRDIHTERREKAQYIQRQY